MHKWQGHGRRRLTDAVGFLRQQNTRTALAGSPLEIYVNRLIALARRYGYKWMGIRGAKCLLRMRFQASPAWFVLVDENFIPSPLILQAVVSDFHPR